ncbi:MAG: OB-fold domain-containing protein [Actinomycetota bacterium]|nr:OB-fold domain-containing protein [Actinomycetota bacterium]
MTAPAPAGHAPAEDLLHAARAVLGGPAGPLRVGRDPVNLPMVHHWCQALGDTNPAYLDPVYAADSARGELIAPPGMLQTWTMDAPRSEETLGSNDEVMRRLDEAGYTSVVAVNYEHEYLRELRHGERISVRSAAEDLSSEKKTALGPGVFTTVRHEYVTDSGELVGVGRMRLLKFRPPAAKAAEPDVGARPKPAVGRDNAYFWEGVDLGELRLQKCGGCGVVRHPPMPLCAECGSTDQGYVTSSGRGRVYSHVTHHYPPLPGVERPHTVLLVELDEGVRMVSELAAGADPGMVRIGLPVELAFQEAPGGQRLPVFRPAA